ncbi:cupin domain-containing protein [Streptomyces sp. NBC_01803]|uniref:cupin domain-containing protein n=1 Tax=Streptomyces sp. NBC_01803 TaxID=2975946 RepID=UPI002DDC3442|nr:cupin domain-containing protein [Streptomyces sp. NBC_01803]WSA42957.1 cupin domain-containing protein [Streptomyces sp. NBC_01803]
MSETLASAFEHSTADADAYEPFVVDGTAVGEVHWIRKEGSGGRTLLVGLWRHTPSIFPYFFGEDETIYALEGVLEVAIEGGETVTLRPGDIYSFAQNTKSTWTVVEPFKKLFVISG